MRVSVTNANANPATSTGLRRYLTGLVSKSDVTDAALVSRFTADGDEDAFTELVRRLGPTVLGVCRRTLGAGPDADDAFQATFIVLAKKAVTLQEPGQVGAWLYRVATLAALKTRSQSRRRYMREKNIDKLPEPLTLGPFAHPDAESVVDEELARLPEQYRAPLVLCGIRGLSAKEAARELGCAVGTVHSRMSRGRSLLARQLARRGISGCGVAALITGAMTAHVSAAYVALALQGKVGHASKQVIQLANLVLQSLAAYKVGIFLSTAACGSLLLFGGFAFAYSKPADTAPVQPLVNVVRPFNDLLARMRLPTLYPWLAQEIVLNDLSCDKSQREEIHKQLTIFRDAVYDEFLARMNQMAPGAYEDRAIAVSLVSNEQAAKFDRSVVPLLRSDQLHRLKQLTLHAQGVSALLDRHVIRALALTPDQEDQIEALLPVGGLSELLHTDNAQTQEEFKSRLAAGLKLLTTEQQTKWRSLVGREISGLDLARGLRIAVPATPILPTDPSTYLAPGSLADKKRE